MFTFINGEESAASDNTIHDSICVVTEWSWRDQVSHLLVADHEAMIAGLICVAEAPSSQGRECLLRVAGPGTTTVDSTCVVVGWLWQEQEFHRPAVVLVLMTEDSINAAMARFADHKTLQRFFTAHFISQKSFCKALLIVCLERRQIGF